MPFIGNKPAQVPLTSADIADGIITSAKITDATIVNGDIANATIALAKLSATGTADATTFLRGDNTFASAGAAAGQVIQVLSATDSTERSSSSTSFVTASNTLSVSITPSSASNKIFIIAHTAAGNTNVQVTIFRGATNLGDATNGMTYHNSAATACITFLDSPNTTSSITYQLYFRSYNGTTQYINNTTPKGSITVMEIKG
jgi:hypothetical protein